jgi:hypothetical protein
MPLVERAQLAQLDDADVPLDNLHDLAIGSFPGVLDPTEQRW